MSINRLLIMITSAASNNINLKYKTSRCRHFDQTGNCQLGDRCHFAHGEHELRTINDVSEVIMSLKVLVLAHPSGQDWTCLEAGPIPEADLYCFCGWCPAIAVRERPLTRWTRPWRLDLGELLQWLVCWDERERWYGSPSTTPWHANAVRKPISTIIALAT